MLLPSCFMKNKQKKSHPTPNLKTNSMTVIIPGVSR